MEVRGERTQIPQCHNYTSSIVSRIHVDTTNLCNITCTLIATGMILRRLECIILDDAKLGTSLTIAPMSGGEPTR